MFKDATVREAELVDRRLDTFTDQWQRTADTWFDGTPDSVDRRIRQLDQMSSFASHATARLGSHVRCASTLSRMRATREQLLDLRERLLTGSVPMGLSMPREAGARSFEDFADELLTD